MTALNNASVRPATSLRTGLRRLSLKPVIVQLSRKLRAIFWPGRQKSASRLLICLLGMAGLMGATSKAVAQVLPTGGVVTSGTATISTSGNAMTVDQASQAAILNWQNFSIGAGNSVRFNQPSASSVALNRVVGNSPSEIYGSLSANGKLLLVNQNGILMGQAATVDTGGFVGSTLNIRDADFLAGRYNFDMSNNTGGMAGSIVNSGRINAPGGYALLIAPQVTNNGFIAARAGMVVIGAGNKVSLDMVGDGLINLKVDEAALNAAVVNTGSIEANGGSVLIKASSANALFDTVLNSTGIIRADSISTQNGRIVLDGGPTGITSVSGEVTARGANAGETGGSIAILGDKVGLFGAAKVDASGDAGGGTVLVGGNWQGGGSERTASRTFVSKDAHIDVSASGNGNGGTAVVWADGDTRMDGSIAARGGATGGAGGNVETSGKGSLDLQGSVDVTAASGHGGSWLLDPTDIYIDANANTALASAGPAVFQDNGAPANAYVNATALGAALTGGATVNVQTSNGGAGSNGNIVVNSQITATGAATLNLIANTDIYVNSAIASNGTNQLNVGLYAGSTGTPASVATAGQKFGAAILNNTGSISTSGGKVVMVSGPLAGISVGGNITTSGGDVSLRANGAGGSLNLSGVVNAGTGTVRLSSDGQVTQSLSGNITASNLGVRANGAVTLAQGTNAVSGAFALANGSTSASGFISSLGFNIGTVTADGSLFASTSGIASSGDVALKSTGAIAVNQDINAGTGTVRLGGASVSQSAGAITAANLGVEAGSISLTGANMVSGIAAFKLNGGTLDFTNGVSYSLGTVGTIAGFTGAAGVTNAQRATLTQTAGTVTAAASAPIQTPALELNGAGNFSLNSALNVVGTIAGSGTGFKKFLNSNALTVGTVNGTVGLSSTGDISLRTTVGAIVLNDAISTTGTVRLQAQQGITQGAGGTITAGSLSAYGIQQAVTLGAANLVSGTVALRTGGSSTPISFTNGSSYEIGEVAADGAFIPAFSGMTGFLTNRVSLTQTAGNVTQAASSQSAIVAADLELKGAGNFTLLNISNAVGNVAGAGTGNKALRSNMALTVGTVNGTAGFNAGSGDLSIRSDAAITVGQAISTGIGAVSLNAGGLLSNTAAISTSGGKISLQGGNTAGVTLGAAVASGGGDITIGSGSGAVALNAAVDAGAGTVRIAAGGALTQTAAITARNLGVRSASTIALTQNNAIDGDVAINNAVAAAVSFKNSTGYRVASISVDAGSLFAGANGMVGNGAFTLESAGPVTQGLSNSAIGVSALELKGAGSFTLVNTANTIGTLAAGAGAGAIEVVNSSTLLVDTVNGSSGISRTGDLSLRSVSGQLNVQQAIDAGPGSIRLQAGTTVSTGAAGSLTTSGGPITLLADNGGANTTAVVSSGNGDVTIKGSSSVGVGTINAGSGTIRLVSGGNISQTGTLTAANLGVNASGAVVLDQENVVGGKFAASNNVLNSMLFKSTQSYAIDSVGADIGNLFVATNGISTPNGANILLASDGAISINQAMVGVTRLWLQGSSVTGNGAISTALLGVRATTGDIVLNGANTVNNTVAMATLTAGRKIEFTNGSSYELGQINAVAPLFSAQTSGISAAGGGSVTLTQTAGTASQNNNAAQSLIQGDLLLSGNGAFNLNNASNVVSKVSASGTGSRKLVSSTGLTVDLVNGVGQLSGSDVSLRAVNGEININRITNVTGTLRLQADAGSIYGTGQITAGNLGVRAAGNVDLGTATNAITGDVAMSLTGAPANSGKINSTAGYSVGSVGPDGAFFAGANGITGNNTQVTLASGGAIAINQAISVGTALRIQAAGAISQSAAGSIAAGAVGARGSSVDLSVANNTAAFVAFDATAGAVQYRNNAAFAINILSADAGLFAATSGISATGAVVLNSNGAITQQGGRTITSAGLTKNGAGSLTLSTTNAINGAVAVNAGSLAVSAGTVGTGNITLAAGTSMDLRNGGTVAGSVTSHGATLRNSTGTGNLGGTLTLGAATDLDSSGGAGLAVAGAVIGGGNALSLVGTGQTSLSAGATGLSALSQTAGGTLNLGTGQTIASSGAQTYNGTVTGSNLTLNAGAGSITATGAGNNFTGTLNLAGANVSVVNAGALTTVLNTTGHAALTAGGNLTTSGTSGNLTTLATGAGTTSLGASTVNGTLGISSAGAVSQTGALTQTGAGNAVTITASNGNIKLDNTSNNVAGTVNLAAANGGVALTNNSAGGIKAGNITAAITLNNTSPADLANFTASDAALTGAVVLRALQGNIERSGATTVVADRAVLVAANRIGGASTTDATTGLRLEGPAGASIRRVDASAAATQPASLFGAATIPVVAPITQAGATSLPIPSSINYNGMAAYVPPVPAPVPSGTTGAGGSSPSTASQIQVIAQLEGDKANDEAARRDGVQLDVDGAASTSAVLTGPVNPDDVITVPSCAPGAKRIGSPC